MLRYIQQSQEQLNAQVALIARQMEEKANKADLPTAKQFEDLLAAHKAGPTADMSSVSTQVLLKEMSASIQRKADASNVASLQQVSRLAALVDQKANAKDVPTAAQIAQLTALVSQAGIEGSMPLSPTDSDGPLNTARLEQLAADVERKASAADVNATLKQVQALHADLRELRHQQRGSSAAAVAPATAAAAAAGAAASAAASAAAERSVEVKKVQVVVAAAGARFDKQLRELRQQLRQLREECGMNKELQSSRLNEDGSAGSARGLDDARWPGRVLSGSRAASDAGSLIDSDTGSLTGSMAGSMMSLGPEEKAELKKIQAIVGAAGTAFSRDLRDIREQLRALLAEMNKVKERLGLPPASFRDLVAAAVPGLTRQKSGDGLRS